MHQILQNKKKPGISAGKYRPLLTFRMAPLLIRLHSQWYMTDIKDDSGVKLFLPRSLLDYFLSSTEPAFLPPSWWQAASVSPISLRSWATQTDRTVSLHYPGRFLPIITFLASTYGIWRKQDSKQPGKSLTNTKPNWKMLIELTWMCFF